MLNPRPSAPEYWEPTALKSELGRILEICHGCRLCWNLCPSFGNLFKRIDALDESLNGPVAPYAGAGPKPEGEHAAAADPSLAAAKDPVQALGDDDRRRLVDECYQCKLCYNACPYHPPHRFALDFPRLLQRAKAVRVRGEGLPLFDRLFSRADLVGRLAVATAPLANWAARQPVLRALLEAALGLHRNRRLPSFSRLSFRQWWDWRGPKTRGPEVVLFYTCSVDYNEPRTGRAAVAVLERNGLQPVCPEVSCCGMPLLDAGDIEAATKTARRNVKRLLPFALRGVPIVALGPTCSYMLREEYPNLLDSEDARLVARTVKDSGEFLMELARSGRLDHDFAPVAKRIVYQPPCHLKAQNFGLKSRDLLAKLPGAQVTVADRCSAHDGTWSMKKPYFEVSMAFAGTLFGEIEAAAPDAVATDCPLAAVQIEQGTGRTAEHPVVLLARAYGFDDDRP